jgi:hypothetical protein
MKQPILKALLLLVLFSSSLSGQKGESPLKIFGFFQTTFQHWTDLKFETTHPEIFEPEKQPAFNTFNTQQLNTFFKKDLGKDWRAFINFEILNTFSSARNWGSFNLEEAWVRYRASDGFKLQVGLSIPIFNNLNEIKNRTPILPYIIRPIVYESSFSEFFEPVELVVPNRAWIMAYGIIPSKQEVKYDWAIYIGNSPNIASGGGDFQTGVDTTGTFLLGGRIGIHYKELKVGLSATHDKVNQRDGEYFINGVHGFLIDFNEVPRIRLGMDLSFRIQQFSFEGEYIKLNHKDNDPDINFGGFFFYGTGGINVTDHLFLYASYQYLEAKFPFIASTIPNIVINTSVEDLKLPTLGFAYNLNDRIVFKGQYAKVLLDSEFPFSPIVDEVGSFKREFDVFALAMSVFF